jgi:hypothetical protein
MGPLGRIGQSAGPSYLSCMSCCSSFSEVDDCLRTGELDLQTAAIRSLE